jgi:glycosyltransferase involved in cell wall biosynthesis
MLDPWFNLNNKIKQLKKIIYWKLMEQFTINNSNAVLFTSEEERKLARKPFKPYSPVEKVVAYGCPLVEGDVNQLSNLFLDQHPELINKVFGLFLSRIHTKKGIDLLISALANISNMPDEFVLAIAGPDSNGLILKLKTQISLLGLEQRVVWLGMLQGDIKYGAYHAAEFFVLPSHQENFGIVVAEALSTGTPVLITNKVNIWREIVAAGAGFVADDDVDGVKNLLNRWFELTTKEKLVMTMNAKACYQNNFSIESAVTDLEKVLLNVINTPRK